MKPKRTIGFVPHPHESDRDREPGQSNVTSIELDGTKIKDPFNAIKVRCYNDDCSQGGVHALSETGIQAGDLSPELLPHLQKTVDHLQKFVKDDPQAAELIDPFAKAGFGPKNPLIEAIGMSPIAKIIKKVAEYDQNAIRFVRVQLVGDDQGKEQLLDPVALNENFKSLCAAHFKRLPPLVQFTVLERLLARGFAPEDFGLESTAPAA